MIATGFGVAARGRIEGSEEYQVALDVAMVQPDDTGARGVNG